MTTKAPLGYHIRGFDPSDLEALYRVGGRATEVLANTGYPAVLESPAPTLAEFETLFAGKGVWVAATDDGDHPVGYARAGELSSEAGNLIWLHQIDVDPDHMRKGLGRALLMSVLDYARFAFHTAVGLSTFKTVPFNAPFYERAGFVQVAPDALPPAIAEQFAAEMIDGIVPSTRTVMLRRL